MGWFESRHNAEPLRPLTSKWLLSCDMAHTEHGHSCSDKLLRRKVYKTIFTNIWIKLAIVLRSLIGAWGHLDVSCSSQCYFKCGLHAEVLAGLHCLVYNLTSLPGFQGTEKSQLNA